VATYSASVVERRVLVAWNSTEPHHHQSNR
jgi:hypothetical protein